LWEEADDIAEGCAGSICRSIAPGSADCRGSNVVSAALPAAKRFAFRAKFDNCAGKRFGR
jgi:hypothetical protein